MQAQCSWHPMHERERVLRRQASIAAPSVQEGTRKAARVAYVPSEEAASADEMRAKRRFDSRGDGGDVGPPREGACTASGRGSR